jgi:hypothetical protein
MDPLSITVGSLQIVSLCAQSTVALAQWVGDVKTVDERIDAFSTEIKALSATYEALHQSSFPSHVEGCTSVRVFFRRAAMAANCKSHQRLRKYDGDFEPDPGEPECVLWECIPSTLQTIS